MSRELTLALGLVVVVLLVFGLPRVREVLTGFFLFHPQRGQERTPAAVGLEFEEQWIQAPDGVRTQNWWIPYQGPAERRLPVAVLSFHGNAGTMSDRLEYTRPLHDLGVSQFIAEYRGYGDSQGRPNASGLEADAHAALDWLRESQPELKIVAHGRSLGGAVAISLSDQPLDGLFVESTFTSLTEMAPRSGLPFAAQLIAYDFPSKERIGRYPGPVFLVHGGRDELIPFSMGEALAEEVRQGAGRLSWFPVAHGEHNNVWGVAGPGYWTAVRAWLEEIAG